MSRFLSASEAAEKLGITLPTLYAYVSRGLIRSEALQGSTRQRRYYAEDVEKLLERKEAARNPEKLAESALNWGTPVLESRLTLILDHGLYYRGQDALQLAERNTIEQVAALLWLDDMDSVTRLFADAVQLDVWQAGDHPYLTEIHRMQMALSLAAGDDLAAYDLKSESAARTGARILRLMTLLAVGRVAGGGSMVERLHEAWCPDHVYAARWLNAALILCADHELNASSFTARVVAGAEATPYAVVIAGLSALQGAKHGGSTERVGAFLREVGTPRHARTVIAERLRRGEIIPGFGHRLYPNGDPRAETLLAMLREQPSPALELADAIMTEAERLIDHKPNIDFALSILVQALNLPASSALVLFALGRTVGWIGHAIEQYETGQLIRPRARYTGNPPSDG